MTKTDREIMEYHLGTGLLAAANSRFFEAQQHLASISGTNGAQDTGIQASALSHSVPADLPSNIPNPDKYPQARYGGLHRFCQLLPPDVRWDFVVDIGGRRNETPAGGFWDKAFATDKMIMAYFRLRTVHRVYFLQNVVWIRDPLPGRPGGVQVIPPEWPGNLPTPVHHVMTRYAGLADWVAKLPDNWAEVARLSLFGIHERFDDVWWSDYHKTVDVYNLYSRLTPALRDGFEEEVYWIPDGPAPKDPKKTASAVFLDARAKSEGKFCYLSLFRDDHHDRVKASLGENPWAVEVAAILLAEPGIWHPGQFKFSISSRNSTEGQAYLQGHVERTENGVPTRQLLPYLSGALRLGATSDINALANLQLQDSITVKPTLFPTRAVGGGPGLEMVYNVYAQLNKTENVLAWVPMDHPSFSWLLGAFESVRILEAEFSMQMSTGAPNSLLCAICGPSVDLQTTADWYSAAVNTELHGSDQGYVSGTFVLPQPHPFETEIRSPDPTGNPPPTFRFNFAGVAGGKVMIKGMLKVRVNGQAVLGHIDIGPKAPKKSSARMRSAIVESLPYNIDGVTRCSRDDGEEDSDSDVPEPPRASSSSPRANTAVPRSG